MNARQITEDAEPRRLQSGAMEQGQTRAWQFTLQAILWAVALAATIFWWIRDLRTPFAGRAVVPVAIAFGIFVGRRASGRPQFRCTVGFLSFLGTVLLGCFGTLIARWSIGADEAGDLEGVIAVLAVLISLPFVSLIALLLIRAFVWSVNAKK